MTSEYARLHLAPHPIRGASGSPTIPSSRELAAMDVHHLVVLPEMHTGALTQPAELTAEQWRDLVDGQSKLGQLVREQFDVRAGFQPHVDTHVDTQRFVGKFLADTDPDAVSLCLDTGHIEYCSGVNREIVHRHPDRISSIHLKQVNPAVAAQARAGRVGFYEAVRRGAMVEPPLGAPAMAPLLDDLAALNRDLRLIIEQDMYPAPAGSAKAIANRTRDYFAGLGLPPAENWRGGSIRSTDELAYPPKVTTSRPSGS